MRKKSRPDIVGYSYKLLGQREHTEKELSLKLQRRGYEEAEIAAVLENLRETGSIDDKRFAEKWLDYCRGNKPMGKMRIVAELARRGVDFALAKEFVEREYSGEEERALLHQLALSLTEKKGLQTYEEALAQIGPYLFRRGFSREDIFSALRKAIDTCQSDELLSDG
jgi:regulatory protein